MKVYQIHSKQVLPISMEAAWEFLSDPKNLELITPPDMKFTILGDLHGRKTYAGQIINYRISPFKGITMSWTTEISHCQNQEYFVDEQRFGPYTFWHHKHFLKKIEGGVLMEDIVDYALPFGILGQFAHWLFVRKKLKKIFNYRTEAVRALFSNQ
jgi:ligand-binding SRPBCC domain-containing protein